MTQDPLTLYKLIILYMLNRVSFPLTKSQISDFILEKEYTTFLTLQQAITDLTDTNMISAKLVRNRTHLSITDEGQSTLLFFENRISDAIKADIDSFFREKELILRNEISITSEYYRITNGTYEAHLVAKEKGIDLLNLTMSVPLESMAASICDNWQTKNQEIYKYLTLQLF